ncbi:RNA-directed DNA polymerase from mobile element jockey [Eumeta japonica]|nr:RNA-directed DNA polymerase from mobile element jockey [Eumeta japonica]
MIDVCLISESHTTSRSRINVPGYSVYLTPHPDGGAHAGAAIIIKNSVKHCLLDPFAAPYLQATSIRVEDRSGFLNLSAIYCPPRHTIKEEMFSDFFKTLGNRFIAGGDWNAKHSHWGSRITVTRGKELKKSIDANHLRSMSTGEPTYWPTDSNKTPDLLDFFITKNICLQNTLIKSSLDGSSDHTPVILILSPIAIPHDSGTDYLHNSKTDWDCFREYLESNIDLKLSLKTNEEVDNASLYITNLIQVAAWTSTLS